MANLGVPYRVVYTSANFSAGLMRVNAMITRPDNVVVGPLLLIPFAPNSGFSGMYYADFVTSFSDPPGEYIGVIRSPEEREPTGAMIRRGFRISMARDYGEQNSRAILALAGQFAGGELIGNIPDETDDLIGTIDTGEGLVGSLVKEEVVR